MIVAQDQLEVGGWPPISEMTFAVPLHSRKKINRAGKTIAKVSASDIWSSDHSFDEIMNYYIDVSVVNNWRSSHSGPLLHMRMLLTNHARRIDPTALVAQRIKRLSSIELKLQRFPTMTLSQMQDIGGCRAIVDSVKSVQKISASIQNSRTKHYIAAPQPTGYRGIHLIYRFEAETALQPCSGMKIEMQIRSLLQHAWATAVETVGTLTKQALKSSRGEAEWLRFFALMGTVVAIEEGTPRVANTPDNDDELMRDVARLASELAVINRLESFRQALRQTEELMTADARYFL